MEVWTIGSGLLNRLIENCIKRALRSVRSLFLEIVTKMPRIERVQCLCIYLCVYILLFCHRIYYIRKNIRQYKVYTNIL